MATKKEKCAAGEARAAAQREYSIASGLKAQMSDRAARARYAEKMKHAAEEMSKKTEQKLDKLKKTKQKLANLNKLRAMAPSFPTQES